MTTNQTPQVNKYGVKVGDIFYTSWGYDETHINFYQVVRVTAAAAEVVPIVAEAVEQNGPGGDQVVPTNLVKDWDVLIRVSREDKRKSKLCKFKRYSTPERPVLALSADHAAYPHVDGRTYYQTDPRWGR